MEKGKLKSAQQKKSTRKIITLCGCFQKKIKSLDGFTMPGIKLVVGELMRVQTRSFSADVFVFSVLHVIFFLEPKTGSEGMRKCWKIIDFLLSFGAMNERSHFSFRLSSPMHWTWHEQRKITGGNYFKIRGISGEEIIFLREVARNCDPPKKFERVFFLETGREA